ncbi:MAG: hypothetical protein J6S67_22165 [Methanobrevibacter sp.]|nr:hypothetical protein [Methanobrevibacter sp.]
MTQRIFDVENEKDMQDLWDILPDEALVIKKDVMGCQIWETKKENGYTLEMIKINWHNKTEITRPIQEATEQDIGKLCYFWDNNTSNGTYCILVEVNSGMYKSKRKGYYEHARRLTKQEIEELC